MTYARFVRPFSYARISRCERVGYLTPGSTTATNVAFPASASGPIAIDRDGNVPVAAAGRVTAYAPQRTLAYAVPRFERPRNIVSIALGPGGGKIDVTDLLGQVGAYPFPDGVGPLAEFGADGEDMSQIAGGFAVR